MKIQAPTLAALGLLAALLSGCDSGAATAPEAPGTGSGTSVDGGAGPRTPGEAADYAGQAGGQGRSPEADPAAADPDVVETKIRVGGMVITRKRPRYVEPDKRVKVVKDADADFNFPYEKRGEKGEHLNRKGKVVKDEKGKTIKMN